MYGTQTAIDTNLNFILEHISSCNSHVCKGLSNPNSEPIKLTSTMTESLLILEEHDEHAVPNRSLKRIKKYKLKREN